MNSHQYPREADYKIIRTKLIPRCAGTDGRARPFHALSITALLVLFLAATSAFAGSATWARFPQSGNWGFPGNWSPQTVPNGPSDTATFVTSIAANVSLSQPTEVNGIVFNSSGIFGSTAFTITASGSSTLVISGVGITNNSGLTQNFVTAFDAVAFAVILFRNTATAGRSTVFTNYASTVSGKSGGITEFFDNTSAGNNTFISEGGTTTGTPSGPAGGGGVFFYDNSTAASATLIADPGSNGGYGGLIEFASDSTGGTSRIEVFGNESSNGGLLKIDIHNLPGVTIGSLEGNGIVFLGANNLTVGSNNRNTVFSGEIEDGFYAGGSLTKIGAGTLTLGAASTYSGPTTISEGTLLVKNTRGSATGTGPVNIYGGTLEGVGTISGALRAGGQAAGILLAGNSATTPGTLTINNTLTFNLLSSYKCVLNRSTGKASKVTAVGVTINGAGFTNGASFGFVDIGSGALASGTVFTVINNISGSPINGAFSNLPDKSVFTSNGTNFKVSYSGGTGNDLTLTVVP
jgi:autotransporter-associated beta strand protein